MDCLDGLPHIASDSIDCILTDPPYLYLKNQKLDRPFDEDRFFIECKRVLKKEGFIILFGRGSSFYRWNTILAGMGFVFKEEIIYDKGYCTSPLMSISRVHESISIHTKKNGSIKKVKIPYLEMKSLDFRSIIQDIKRLKSVLNNTKSLNSVIEYLENNAVTNQTERKHNHSTSVQPSKIMNDDRAAAVVKIIKSGMNEKSIIRTDFVQSDTFSKAGVTTCGTSAGDGDRCVKVVNAIYQGMNEKSIIKEVRDHYKSVHPTQKPVRLLERLLSLTTKEGDVVLDPFSGSASTAIASINTSRKFIGFEIDQQFYEDGLRRVNETMANFKSRLFI